MKLTGLTTVEELTIQNMKLQYQLDQVIKLKDAIDYVVIDGQQKKFSDIIHGSVGIEPEVITAAKRAEYALIAERIQNTLNIVADEFSSVLLVADLDRKDIDMRTAKRNLAVDAYALIHARTCLNMYADSIPMLQKLNLIKEAEAARIHAVKAIINTICDNDGKERETLYQKMLLVGAKIMQSEIITNYSLPIFKASTKEELKDVLDKVITEMEINIDLLNKSKTN